MAGLRRRPCLLGDARVGRGRQAAVGRSPAPARRRRPGRSAFLGRPRCGRGPGRDPSRAGRRGRRSARPTRRRPRQRVPRAGSPYRRARPGSPCRPSARGGGGSPAAPRAATARSRRARSRAADASRRSCVPRRVSAPGLLRIWSGIAILPRSWRYAPRAMIRSRSGGSDICSPSSTASSAVRRLWPWVYDVLDLDRLDQRRQRLGIAADDVRERVVDEHVGEDAGDGVLSAAADDHGVDGGAEAGEQVGVVVPPRQLGELAVLERQHRGDRHRRREHEGELDRVLAEVPAAAVTPDHDQQAGDDDRRQRAPAACSRAAIGRRAVEAGRVVDDCGDEQRSPGRAASSR